MSIFAIDRQFTGGIDSLYRIAGETLSVFCGQALSALGTLFGVYLLTNVLPPDTYGEIALGITAFSFLQQLLIGPLFNSFLRFHAPAIENHQYQAFLLGGFKVIKQTTVLLFIAATLTGVGLQLSGKGNLIRMEAAVFLLIAISFYNSVLDGLQTAARRRVLVAWHQALAQWLRYVFAAGLCFFFGKDSFTAMMGYSIGILIVLVSQTLFFKAELVKAATAEGTISPDEIKTWHRQIWNYARPFAYCGAFTGLLMASDRWALQSYSTTYAVGIYSVLYQIGSYPISLLSGLVLQVAIPIIFARAGDATDTGRRADSKRIVDLMVLSFFLLTIAGTLLAYLLHGQIFSLLVSPRYRELSYLLPVVIFSSGIFSMAQAASVRPMAEMRPNLLIKPKIVTSVSGILLNCIGASIAGATGVVVAGTLFSIFYFCWMLYSNNKFTSIEKG